MIRTLEVTNYVGDKMTFYMTNPYINGFAITKMTGVAELKANINTSEVATNDGALYNSARTQTRNIVLYIAPLWTKDHTVEEARHTIQKMFPIKKKVNLHFITDVRNVVIEGYVESSSTDIFNSKYEEAQISILCVSPYFEDYYPQYVNFSGTDPRFEFPFGYVPLGHAPHFDNSECDLTANTAGNIIVSELFNDTIRDIYYKGDAENGMEFSIYALQQASNFTIYNMETGETMGITFTMQPQDKIVISTIRNKKSAYLIRNGIYTNILNHVSKDATWLELHKGDNIIAYAAEEGEEYLQFSVTVRVLYEGI